MRQVGRLVVAARSRTSLAKFAGWAPARAS